MLKICLPNSKVILSFESLPDNNVLQIKDKQYTIISVISHKGNCTHGKYINHSLRTRNGKATIFQYDGSFAINISITMFNQIKYNDFTPTMLLLKKF